MSDNFVHDAEYYVVEVQNKEKWAAEDKDLDARLAELRVKHGTPPNIIHIMFDDLAFGDCYTRGIRLVAYVNHACLAFLIKVGKF